jgi:hypothetical protein
MSRKDHNIKLGDLVKLHPVTARRDYPDIIGEIGTVVHLMPSADRGDVLIGGRKRRIHYNYILPLDWEGPFYEDR